MLHERNKPPPIYGLPKIQTEQIPLRPITSSRVSSITKISKFLRDLIKPIQDNSKSYIQLFAHFVDLLRPITINANDKLVNFDVENLYTNVLRVLWELLPFWAFLEKTDYWGRSKCLHLGPLQILSSCEIPLRQCQPIGRKQEKFVRAVIASTFNRYVMKRAWK